MKPTEEFVKKSLVVSSDKKFAELHSADICHFLVPGFERDEAFEEAISVCEKMGWLRGEQELDTFDGGCTQHFYRE